MSKRLTVRLPEQAMSALGETDELSQRITACLIRYEAICRDLMPRFSRAEWCAIFDANNGASDVFAEVTGPMPPGVWANVEDANRLDGLGEKWGIDAAALVSKLQGLSRAELLAVEEAIARFWSHCDLDTDEAIERAWVRLEAGEDD